MIGGKLVFARGNEEEITKQKSSFGFLAMGLIIISIAEVLAFRVFSPAENILLEGSEGLNSLKDIADLIILYLQYIVGAVLVFKGLQVAMQMISGSEEENEKAESAQKDFFKSMIFGTLIVFFAGTLVDGIFFVNQETVDSVKGIEFIASIINLALIMISVIAMAMLTLSSLYLEANFSNEEAVGHAKSIVIGSVVALVLSYSSYALSRFIFSSYFGF
jgi:ABC-type multidrug transport system fused ATPase/permease subunit